MIPQTGHWLHPDAQSLSLLLMIWQVPLALAVVLAVGYRSRFLEKEIGARLSIAAQRDHYHAWKNPILLVQCCDYR
jgi:hypothetical protein